MLRIFLKIPRFEPQSLFYGCWSSVSFTLFWLAGRGWLWVKINWDILILIVGASCDFMYIHRGEIAAKISRSDTYSAAFTWCQRYTEFSGVWLHSSPHWPALSPCVILPRFGEHWRFDRSGVCWNLSESTQVSELPLVCTWSFHCFYNFSRLILKVHNGSQVADFLRVIELNRCFNCTAFN